MIPTKEDVRHWIRCGHNRAEEHARAKQKAIWQSNLDEAAAEYIAEQLQELLGEQAARLKAVIRRQTVDVDNGDAPNGPCEAAIEELSKALASERFKYCDHVVKANVANANAAAARMAQAMAADTKELREAADEFFGEDFTKP